MSDFAPMADGGQWLAEGSGQAQYVANPDHVARLLGQGYSIVSDPRVPAEVEPAPAKDEKPAKDDGQKKEDA